MATTVNNATKSYSTTTNQEVSSGTQTDLTNLTVLDVNGPFSADSVTTTALMVNGAVALQGSVAIAGTTESTNKDTGALVLEGGIGVEKNANVGGNVGITGTLGVSGASTLGAVNSGNTAVSGTLSSTGQTTLTANISSSSVNNGTLVVTGGAGISGNLFVGNVYGQSLIKSDGTVDSTNSTSGALRCAGGGSVEKQFFVGTNLRVRGTTTPSDNITGAVIIGDGATQASNTGIGGGVIRTGGSITAANMITTSGSTTNAAVSATNTSGAYTGTLINVTASKTAASDYNLIDCKVNTNSSAFKVRGDGEVTINGASSSSNTISQGTLTGFNGNGSFSGTMLELSTTKAPADDFTMIECKANNVSQFKVRGDGQITVLGTQNSTNSASGALISYGGVGVQGSVNAETALNQPVVKITQSATDNSFTSTALQVNCARPWSSVYNLLDLRNNTSDSMFSVRGDGRLFTNDISSRPANWLNIRSGAGSALLTLQGNLLSSNVSYRITSGINEMTEYQLDRIIFGMTGGPQLSNYLIVNGAGTGVILPNNNTAWAAQSDRRIKKDIQPLKYGLQEIMQLKPSSFKLKPDKAEQQRRIGFIAQEVDAVVPEIVGGNKKKMNEPELEDDADTLHVTTTDLIPILVKAIQELKTEIDELRDRVRPAAAASTSSKKRKMS